MQARVNVEVTLCLAQARLDLTRDCHHSVHQNDSLAATKLRIESATSGCLLVRVALRESVDSG